MAINLKKMKICFVITLLLIFTNVTFIFTCRGLEGNSPKFGIPNPVNGSANQPSSFTWSIPINNSDLFNWWINCSNGRTAFGSGIPPFKSASLPPGGASFSLKWSKTIAELGLINIPAEAVSQDVDGDGYQEAGVE